MCWMGSQGGHLERKEPLPCALCVDVVVMRLREPWDWTWCSASGVLKPRKNVMKDLHQEVVEVPVKAFCLHYLPGIRDSVALDSTHKTILQSEAVVDASWKDFSQPPASCEDLNFQRLVRIVDQICHICGTQSNAERTVKFACRPHNTTASEIEGGSFKSDGIFYLANSSVPPYIGTANYQEWFSADVVGNAEFKLKDTPAEVHKNRGQVVGGATRYIANDPRRTHMYSLTIEKDSCRLWYYCRSHCVKSEAFSLSTDIRSFIHFVISISFATEEDLGFDPTIRRRRNEDNTIYYEYKLNHTVYKTLSLISEHPAAAITGRGTRVWRVEVLDGTGTGTGTVRVLKDYWVDDVPDENGQCITENLILTKIYRRLDELKNLSPSDEPSLTDIPEAEREVVLRALQNYRDYFVNISSCETLKATKDICSGSRCCSVIEESRVSLGEVQHPRSFLRRRHCRLLYDEECTAFYAIDNLEEAIQVLHDCVLGLQLLYLAGFVHRDISPGNVLLHRHAGGCNGKLSDFEYAKPFSRDDPVARDPKTGTPGFISVEVYLQDYLYLPRSAKREINGPIPFSFNFLHDMDSVLWITLYLFATRTLLNDAIDVTKTRNIFHLHFSYMFTPQRQFVFMKPLSSIESLCKLYAATYPSPSYAIAGRSVFELLCDVTESLGSDFEEVEKSLEKLGNAKSYSAIYGPVRETIDKLLGWAKGLPSKHLHFVYGRPPGSPPGDVPPGDSEELPPAIKKARKDQLRQCRELIRKEPDDQDDGSSGEMTKRQRTDDDMEEYMDLSSGTHAYCSASLRAEEAAHSYRLVSQAGRGIS
ncbi:hypothetical protein GGX14DRAFT_636222 [Mycena pura]|uniref:Protein kinase domain-containing protein n=1 Tax=Mycena pura TaxID=153505 RepID=A0AAD6YFG7_9AGAR|nr:hypothetical protein GGX14DRAFT_636222 [Mycena pura]